MIETKMRKLEMRRFATLWGAEGDFKRIGPQCIELNEPLNTLAPLDAKPYCSSWDVTFYDAKGSKILERVHCHGWECGSAPDVWLIDGEWWEITGGEIRVVNNQWCIVRRGYRNTRAARMMRAGWPFYKSSERVSRILAGIAWLLSIGRK